MFFLEALRAQAPAGDFEEMKKNLDISFDAGLLDSDIVHVLESQVPPGDLRQISAFRSTAHQKIIGIFMNMLDVDVVVVALPCACC